MQLQLQVSARETYGRARRTRCMTVSGVHTAHGLLRAHSPQSAPHTAYRARTGRPARRAPDRAAGAVRRPRGRTRAARHATAPAPRPARRLPAARPNSRRCWPPACAAPPAPARGAAARGLHLINRSVWRGSRRVTAERSQPPSLAHAAMSRARGAAPLEVAPRSPTGHCDPGQRRCATHCSVPSAPQVCSVTVRIHVNADGAALFVYAAPRLGC